MGARRHGESPVRARTRRGIGSLIALALVVAACSSGDDDDDAAPSTTAGTVPTGLPGTGAGTGASAVRTLGVRLSEGSPAAGEPEATPVVTGTALDDAAVAAVVARLSDWEPAATTAPFAWPAESLRPPVPGTTVDLPFPAAEQVPAPEVPTGPLQVVRHQPDGTTTGAAFVTVTFDRPMVPIGTVGRLAAEAAPASIDPPLAGAWQWIGTRTLRFDAAPADGAPDRLPMATEYRVTVPAGTTAADGSTLAEAVAFEFTTPPPSVVDLGPTGESLSLEPVFVALFDQLVDAEAVLDAITLTAADDEFELRPATEDELAADEWAAALTGRAPEGRWVAFRAVEPLPADAAVEITVGPGTPSAEGPLTAPEAETFRARTYPPLRVVRAACSSGSPCVPGTGLWIELSNPLDPLAFDPTSVVVEPPIPGAAVYGSGNTIEIAGATLARTTYTVTLPATLTDVHGQQLGEPVTESVTIGPATPSLLPFRSTLTTLDPAAPAPALPVRSVNHEQLRVRVYRVTPSDWPAYLRYLASLWRFDETEVDEPEWPLVSDDVIDTTDGPDRTVETAVALDDALTDGRGHAVVVVEPVDPVEPDDELYWSNQPAVTWVQATEVGLDAFADADELVAWTTDLATGEPLTGVSVGFADADERVPTDADGLTTLALATGGNAVLVAQRGDDTAILPAALYEGALFQRYEVDDELRWYVVDDRGTYRPGETASVTGWVRRLTTSGEGRLVVPDDGAALDYRVFDAQYAELDTGTVALDPSGAFTLTVELPEGVNLGPATIEFELRGVPGLAYAGAVHSFSVQEFRRPEFEVTARPETPEPYVSRRPATVAVDAAYYAGGPLGAAPVTWQVTTTPAAYSPPGWETFSFGEWTPWWIEGDGFARDAEIGGPWFPGGESEVETFTGVTDVEGHHYLQMDFTGDDDEYPDLPVTVQAAATVEDVDRQAWSASTNVLVHPAELYVGLRSDRPFVREGESIELDVVVTDIEGAAVPGRSLTVEATRLQWTMVRGEWTETEVDPRSCEVVSAAEPVPCAFPVEIGGSYRIRATVTDDLGGVSRTEITRWVSGASGLPDRGVEQQSLTLVPDQERYEVGETARLLVQSPFSGAGIALVTRNGIVATERFTVVDGSAELELPITAGDVPGVEVTLEVVGTTTRTADDGTPLTDAPGRPAYATGTIALPVSTATRTLTVTAEPAEPTLEPGGATTLAISVTGPDGAPVPGAELAVVVADEAVLAVGAYEFPDPIDVFYGRVWSQLSTRYGRESVQLSDPAGLDGGGTASGASDTTAAAAAEESAAPAAVGADDAAGGEAARDASFDTSESGPIAERTDLDPLAVFLPGVVTGADGTAVVDVPLPDTLTRYRVMVAAVHGDDRFGAGESNITARLPLSVRPSAPRFANFGDAFELPVVVQNLTDTAAEVDVVVQTDNLRLDGPAGQRVSVPAGDRVEVRFPVSTVAAGTARFRAAVAGAAGADAVVIELPVYTPATAEAFATYGVLDEGATAQPLLAPTGVIPEFGGLEITTSSTALQGLTDAVLSVTDHPYGSSDALALRILTVAALRDVLEAFAAEGLPDPATLDASVDADLAALVALQNDDGGFPTWSRSRRSEPVNSVQAAHALVAAGQAGYTVPETARTAALAYLSVIEQSFPPEYTEAERDALHAQALHVRFVAGDRDPAAAQEIWDRRGSDLDPDSIAWLWPVVDDPGTAAEMARELGNRIVETAGAAHVVTDWDDTAAVTLASDTRTDGIVLDALVTMDPDSDLIPKLVTGVLGTRTNGRWGNVQENTYVLLALRRYFETFEGQDPAFTARAWLGEQYAGEQVFSGRSTESRRITVPTADLVAAGDTSIVMAREGTGRLYYRLGLRYAPADLTLDPLDRGFTVQRTYEAVDDPADVTRDADGTWAIRAGALVRVRLTMVAESERHHAALIDPLPAGLEIVNPDLAVSQPVSDDPLDDPVAEEPELAGFSWWWERSWYDHQNQRDDRAEAFAAYLPAGTYDYSYVARATTPGAFVVPPTRAEEIYAPETFGRAATDRVRIAP